MVSFKMVLIGQMDQLLSTNALLPLVILFCMTSESLIKLVSENGQFVRYIRTAVKHLSGTFWYHSHLSTQYCDGLRGVLVIYDPHDPHRHLYDIDNGEFIITSIEYTIPMSKLTGLHLKRIL